MTEIPPRSEEEFPSYLYVYGADGVHTGKTTIPDEAALRRIFVEVVAPAIRAGQKVIVTDALDFCMFHAEGGQIIFPTAEHIAQMAAS